MTCDLNLPRLTGRQLESRLSMARELGLAPDAFPDAAGQRQMYLAFQVAWPQVHQMPIPTKA